MNGSIIKGKKMITKALDTRWNTTPLLWALHAQHNECVTIGIHLIFGICRLKFVNNRKQFIKFVHKTTVYVHEH